MAAITIYSDFGAPQNKIWHCFHCFPSISHEVMGPDAINFVFWMLSFKPTFSLSSFTFIKRFFNSSSLSAIRVVSSAYLRLLIFLLAILIPACESSSPAFLLMYSTCKLNNQGDNIQPWCTPFSIWHQSVVPCPVLTVASWPAYRFLKRQVRCSGIPISFRIFQFIVIHTVKGFGIVNKAEIDVFLELSSFFHDPVKHANSSGLDCLLYCFHCSVIHCKNVFSIFLSLVSEYPEGEIYLFLYSKYLFLYSKHLP